MLNTLFTGFRSIIPELLAITYAMVLYLYRDMLQHTFVEHIIGFFICYLLLRSALYIIRYTRLNRENRVINSIIDEFKKGKFSLAKIEPVHSGPYRALYENIISMGRHLESLMSSQSYEILNLRELYDNIILSMSSYFIVINENEEIIFANETFCKKFQFDLDEIVGSQLDDIFFFLTGRIKEAIAKLKEDGETVILERTHILSKNRISVIGDIKISTMKVKGINQIIFVIDDITSKCRKDYQISLISQISESIQRDDEIDRILYTILRGVTSGSGLGFNRAMLFLLDDKKNNLVGKMAVGPDDIEEAIEIWSSIQASGKTSAIDLNNYQIDLRKGKQLLGKVLATSFSIDAENIFTRSLKNLENIHVYNSIGDDRMDDALRAFIDVNEFVVVPLIAVNRVIGIIIADNKFNQVPISRDSIELLSIFAFQAALSIEGYNNIARLKREVEKIKEKQEAMIESEKLAAVGRIASHIAHEIRNPLVTMGGYAQRILKMLKGGNPNTAALADATTVILNETLRLEKTLSNVMDFTRVSPFLLQFNNINEIIESTVDLLRNLFQESKIDVLMDLDPDLPLVKSDHNQLKQAVLNLLQNSIDATPRNGLVTITSRQEESTVAIVVKNTGSMIRSEDFDRIFEPFFTTKVTGVGLGLAIVKKIIDDHEGKLFVRNIDQLEKGVEFKIQLRKA